MAFRVFLARFMATPGAEGLGLHGHHDRGLLLLSTAIALTAALAALAAVDRIVAIEHRGVRRLWHAGGALAMGLGIWAMHFTAMLAFRLPVPVTYDVTTTALSVVPAILGSGVAISVVSGRSTSMREQGLGALCLALGIGAMHYVGMEGIRTNARLMYRGDLFLLSIVVAFALAVVALWVRQLVEQRATTRWASRATGATIIAFSVTGMHHTAMRAAFFVPDTSLARVVPGLDPSWLAVIVSVVTGIVVALTLTASFFDRRLASVSASLESSEIRYRTILDTMPDAMFTFDDRGTIESVNPAATHQFGYTGDTLLGRSFETLLPGVSDQLRVVTGRHRLELTARHRDGHEFPVELTIGEMSIDRRRLRSGLLRDVTSRRQLEELRERHVHELEGATAALERQAVELAAARDRAEAAGRAKSAFLANMSHELRTPLNAIIGYSEILIEDADASGSQSQLGDLRKIVASGRHLLALITDVLDLSKIEAGRMSVHITDVDIVDVVRRAVATAAPVASARGNRLDVIAASDIGCIRSDETKVHQILLNLIGNAAKFTSDGHVEVRAWREEADADRALRVQVRDTGIGMTSDQLARLFQEFSQADESTTRRYGGTGLGLAISQRLARLLGGEIIVQSQAGQGSTFTLSLPTALDSLKSAGDVGAAGVAAA